MNPSSSSFFLDNIHPNTPYPYIYIYTTFFASIYPSTRSPITPRLLFRPSFLSKRRFLPPSAYPHDPPLTLYRIPHPTCRKIHVILGVFNVFLGPSYVHIGCERTKCRSEDVRVGPRSFLIGAAPGAPRSMRRGIPTKALGTSISPKINITDPISHIHRQE